MNGQAGSEGVDRRAIPSGAREQHWNAADGHAIRWFDWPANATGNSPRGSLLFLPGRGDFYEKWLDAIHHWHVQGWSVSAIDWRGQAFSGRLAEDMMTGHVSDYRVWTDDLGAFWHNWKATTPGPHVIVAHSMGGQIGLAALARGLVNPDAAVLTAPMLGLKPDWMPRPVLHLFAKLLAKLRGATNPAWRGMERPEAAQVDRLALLTHDRDRYADEAWWRAQRPELAFGPPSWGWIERSFASMAELGRAGALEAVSTPLLILSTKQDRLVSWQAIRKAAKRLPNARLVVYGEEARHEILRETDAVRNAALAEIDAFLDETAPSPA